jgi:hypothetical protein
MFIPFNIKGDKPGHSGLGYNPLQCSRITLQGQRINTVPEEVGGGSALTAQKSGLFAHHISLIGFYLQNSHLSAPLSC